MTKIVLKINWRKETPRDKSQARSRLDFVSLAMRLFSYQSCTEKDSSQRKLGDILAILIMRLHHQDVHYSTIFNSYVSHTGNEQPNLHFMFMTEQAREQSCREAFIKVVLRYGEAVNQSMAVNR